MGQFLYIPFFIFKKEEFMRQRKKNIYTLYIQKSIPPPPNSGDGILSTMEYNNIIYNNIHAKKSQALNKSNINFYGKRNYPNVFSKICMQIPKIFKNSTGWNYR